jgi:hypothetical protein
LYALEFTGCAMEDALVNSIVLRYRAEFAQAECAGQTLKPGGRRDGCLPHNYFSAATAMLCGFVTVYGDPGASRKLAGVTVNTCSLFDIVLMAYK